LRASSTLEPELLSENGNHAMLEGYNCSIQRRNAATLVVDMLCTDSAHQRVFWGVSKDMLAAMFIVLEGDAGLAVL
jgi:hypothetical protein